MGLSGGITGFRPAKSAALEPKPAITFEVVHFLDTDSGIHAVCSLDSGTSRFVITERFPES